VILKTPTIYAISGTAVKKLAFTTLRISGINQGVILIFAK
jgi:hypothetical protein